MWDELPIAGMRKSSLCLLTCSDRFWGLLPPGPLLAVAQVLTLPLLHRLALLGPQPGTECFAINSSIYCLAWGMDDLCSHSMVLRR